MYPILTSYLALELNNQWYCHLVSDQDCPYQNVKTWAEWNKSLDKSISQECNEVSYGLHARFGVGLCKKDQTRSKFHPYLIYHFQIRAMFKNSCWIWFYCFRILKRVLPNDNLNFENRKLDTQPLYRLRKNKLTSDSRKYVFSNWFPLLFLVLQFCWSKLCWRADVKSWTAIYRTKSQRC